MSHTIVLNLRNEQVITDIGSQLTLGRPNYRYELLRLALHAQLEDDRMGLRLSEAIGAIGASETPVRRAFDELCRFGLLMRQRRLIHLSMSASELTWDVLSTAGATPQQLKFRFGRGAQIRPPDALLRRARVILSSKIKGLWNAAWISGVPVALRDKRDLNIAGIPRLDLLARIPRNQQLDMNELHRLNPGFEREDNGLAPAPLVLTLTRSETEFRRADRVRKREACKGDVFLALLSAGLGDVARQYARTPRAAIARSA
jgi:hypothetical protein